MLKIVKFQFFHAQYEWEYSHNHKGSKDPICSGVYIFVQLESCSFLLKALKSDPQDSIKEK